jgi:hypothetical protein
VKGLSGPVDLERGLAARCLEHKQRFPPGFHHERPVGVRPTTLKRPPDDDAGGPAHQSSRNQARGEHPTHQP